MNVATSFDAPAPLRLNSIVSKCRESAERARWQLTTSEDKTSHGRSLTGHYRVNRTRDKLHRVEDGEARGDGSAGRIDAGNERRT